MSLCRISNKNTKSFLSFSMPLAGSFLVSSTDPNEYFPLTMEFCEDSGLVQVAEDISPEKLFSKYMYKTGTIQTLVDHFKQSAKLIYNNFTFDTIIEIGCNDLTFLKNFIDQNKNIIGIDPSDIARKAALEKGNNTIALLNTFFNDKIANSIADRYHNTNIIYSSNCFAHISDIKNVTLGVKKLLTDDQSVFICEVHWLGSIIKNLQFPFIYHEHIFYYSLKSLSYLLDMFDIDIYKIEHIPTHGGSIRYYCCNRDARPIENSVFELIQEELDLGLYSFDTFDNFGKKVLQLGKSVKEILIDLKNQGKKIVAYGASGQANTLLSVYDIDSSLVPFIIDDSPLKINKYTSSGLIPIKSSKFLYEHQPDYILCLAYTFFNEIYNKHSSLNCKWIIPLPEIKII